MTPRSSDPGILRPAIFADLPSIVAGFTTRVWAPADEPREADRKSVV